MGFDDENEKCNKIIERIKNGDEEALSEIIQLFKGKVFSVAYGFFRDREDALDVTQEVFIKIWKMIKNIEGKDFEALVIKVTKNICIDHYRAKRKKESKEREMIEETLKGEEGKSQELKEVLENALRVIPERQAFAFSLRFFNDMKLSEISKIMGISEGGAKSLLFKAINNIRKVIKDMEK